MNFQKDFAGKCCQRFQCLRPDYAEKVLWHCLPIMRKTLARVLWLGKPEFFESDLYLINEAGNASTVGEVREIIKFHNKQPVPRSFLRQRLKIRLSRGKLLALAEDVLGPVKPDQPAITLAGPQLSPTRAEGLWR